ncbi:MAG: ABC transporter substrate-binding protein [Abditibacteriales bacterium]|nr:ABC transporter substrate-binding protein [Abditibacteriales bacterium]MDW8364296.1 ABC transporter substrate-binding protein [Abditibacteriales bacterium]
MRKLAVFLFMVVLGVCVGWAFGGASGEILIGEYGSFTGTTADFGKTTHNGIMLAIEEINKKGGVLGKKVRIIAEDDASSPEQAATVVKKLVNQDRVVAVLGEVASSRSMFGAPICQAAKVPMVSPASTNPEVTRKGDYIFRVCFTDDFQGKVMAKFAAEYLKKRRAAILKDVKNDYSVGLAKFFKEDFIKRGGQIVAESSYKEGDKDFRANLASIRAKNPDCIFIPGYYSEVGNIARQARELRIQVPLLGGDGWESSKLIEIGKKAVDGCYFSTHYAIDDKNPETQKRVADFVKAYRAKYKEDPNGLSALGYDAARILCDAIARAKSTEGPKIRAALAATKNFPGVTGNITIDKNRNAVKSAVVMQVVGTKFKFVTRIQP